MTRYAVPSLGLLAALLLATPSAHALGPLDIELGGKVGYGAQTNSGAGTGPFGFGLGARGGVAIFGLYGGLNFMYYLGGSQNAPDGTSVSQHSLMYGVEGGYGFKILDLLTIRGQIGLGNFTYTAASQSWNTLYVEPGITAFVSLGGFFVGADGGILVLPGFNPSGSTLGTPGPALTVHGQLGWKF
jgi:hypothetical protein